MIDFTLEKWNVKYIPDVAEYANNPRVAANLRNAFPNPYTFEDAKWYVNDCISKGDDGQCTRAIVVNNRAVGSIGFFIQNDVYCKCAEVGYWLGEEYWRKGIMSEALKRLCRYGFEHYDIERIYAEPFADNAGSCGVLEKSGFVFEGELRKNVFKNGSFHNTRIYGLLRNDR